MKKNVVIVRVSREAAKELRAFAKARGETAGDAASALVLTGIKRRRAVNKWNAKVAAKAKSEA